MTDPNERQPLKFIDFIIKHVFAIIFYILLLGIQIALVALLAVIKCVTYPIEFVSGFVLEAKDVCRMVLNDEYDDGKPEPFDDFE